jgi:hypothetical protein
MFFPRSVATLTLALGRKHGGWKVSLGKKRVARGGAFRVSYWESQFRRSQPVGECGVSTIEAMWDLDFGYVLSLAATGSRRQLIEKQRSVAQEPWEHTHAPRSIATVYHEWHTVAVEPATRIEWNIRVHAAMGLSEMPTPTGFFSL